MDFIERWFGVSPEGGDGSTELMYLVVFVVVVVVLLYRPVRRRFLAKGALVTFRDGPLEPPRDGS
jgi:hypothetical protein